MAFHVARGGEEAEAGGRGEGPTAIQRGHRNGPTITFSGACTFTLAGIPLCLVHPFSFCQLKFLTSG